MNTRTLALALVSISGLCLSALADPPKDDAVLGGPKVKDLATPGASRTFDGKPNGERKGTPELPQFRYMEILRANLGPSAPPQVRLTSDQEDKIKLADQGFRESQKKYLAANREQVTQLKKDAGEVSKKAKKGDIVRQSDIKNDQQMTPEQLANAPESVRNKAKELREGAPKPAEVQAKIWSYLTPEQQTTLKPKLDAALNEIIHERASKEAQKKVEKKIKESDAKAAKGLPDAADGKRAGKALDHLADMTPEQRAKFKERFDKMPQEQKDKLIAAMKAKGIDPATLQKTGDK